MEPSLFSLHGLSAIVTGSTRGIGYAIAEEMAGAGARVVVSGEDEQAVAAAVRALREAGRDVVGQACDVRDESALEKLVQAALSAFGRLDCLVCNAGITGRPGPAASRAPDDYDLVMAVNLRSVVALCELALPHIEAAGGGSVILLSSISALRGNASINTYALSKAAINQLARNLAVQWGPRGVRVNAIAPGLIRTEMSGTLLRDAAFRERRMAMTPLRRPGEPREVAGAALFLAAPAGAFTTGQVLVVDGGTTITDGS